MCVEASGPAGAGLTTSVTHCLKLMLYVSVATAAMVGPDVVPLIGVVHIVREEEETCPPGAVPLERTDAPELWRMVAELDLLLGTPGDTRIWLTPCVNAEMGVRPLLGRPGARPSTSVRRCWRGSTARNCARSCAMSSPTAPDGITDAAPWPSAPPESCATWAGSCPRR